MANAETAIRSGGDQFETTFQEGKAEGMATLYTEDGLVAPPGGEAAQGREEITDFFQGLFNMGVAEVSLETLEVEDHGDTAFELGEYQLLTEDGETVDAGTYVVLWKRVDGDWRLHRDVISSNG